MHLCCYAPSRFAVYRNDHITILPVNDSFTLPRVSPLHTHIAVPRLSQSHPRPHTSCFLIYHRTSSATLAPSTDILLRLFYQSVTPSLFLDVSSPYMPCSSSIHILSQAPSVLQSTVNVYHLQLHILLPLLLTTSSKPLRFLSCNLWQMDYNNTGGMMATEEYTQYVVVSDTLLHDELRRCE